MIRVLLMIAVAGFVLSIGTLAAAIAIGGPEVVSRGAWGLANGGFYGWDGDRWGWHGEGVRHHAGEAEPARGRATRTLAWTGGNDLNVTFPADIRYVQSEGPGEVTVTGPQSIIDRVVVRDGAVRLDGFSQHWWPHKMQVVVKAPAVNHFELAGANALEIQNYRQDKLQLDISGAAEVTATGEADEVRLDISGTGDVDLSGVKAKSARVSISGAGGATIAPTEAASLSISGMGDVKLLTHPKKLETSISGAGRIRQSDGESATAAPPAPPPPPPAPGKRT